MPPRCCRHRPFQRPLSIRHPRATLGGARQRSERADTATQEAPWLLRGKRKSVRLRRARRCRLRPPGRAQTGRAGASPYLRRKLGQGPEIMIGKAPALQPSSEERSMLPTARRGTSWRGMQVQGSSPHPAAPTAADRQERLATSIGSILPPRAGPSWKPIVPQRRAR